LAINCKVVDRTQYIEHGLHVFLDRIFDIPSTRRSAGSEEREGEVIGWRVSQGSSSSLGQHIGNFGCEALRLRIGGGRRRKEVGNDGLFFSEGRLKLVGDVGREC
jgi:hypothetical protein